MKKQVQRLMSNERQKIQQKTNDFNPEQAITGTRHKK